MRITHLEMTSAQPSTLMQSSRLPLGICSRHLSRFELISLHSSTGTRDLETCIGWSRTLIQFRNRFGTSMRLHFAELSMRPWLRKKPQFFLLISFLCLFSHSIKWCASFPSARSFRLLAQRKWEWDACVPIQSAEWRCKECSNERRRFFFLRPFHVTLLVTSIRNSKFFIFISLPDLYRVLSISIKSLD